MKARIPALLLILILLLSACVPAKPTTEEIARTTQASVSPAESTEQPASTQEATAQASVRPAQEPAPAPSTEPAAPAPSGGIHVYTDDSRYTAYQGPVSLYTRPDTGDLSEFHPQAGLGLVYPYVAEKLYSSYEDGYSYESGYHYGLIDRNGRILTDGIYTDIYPLCDADYEQGYEDHRVTAPIWVTERVGEVTIEHYSDEYGEYSYPVGSTFRGVVAMDGSYALPCEYRSITLLSSADRFLCSKSWEKPDFVIYNLQGEVLLTDSQLLGAYMDCDGWEVQYSEGLYAVSAYYYGTDESGEKTKNVTWFADEQGRRVLGPFRVCGAFCDGLACVSEDGENYGYIDKTGAWVIRPQYAWRVDFEDGRAIQSISGSEQIVIDLKGRVLISEADGYINSVPCGFQVSDNDWTTDFESFYDRDGKLLFSDYGDWSCQSADLLSLSSGDADTGDACITLLSLSTGKKLEVPDASYLYPGAALIDGKLTEGLRGYSYYTDNAVFVPYDLGTVYSNDASGPNSMDRYESSYCLFDQMTGDRFWQFYTESSGLICGEDGQIRFTTRGGNARVIGGLILEIGTFACTYRDRDGRLLFSYPIQTED